MFFSFRELALFIALYGIQLSVPVKPCSSGINTVNSEPSKFITNILSLLELAIYLLSGEKLAYKPVCLMFVNWVISPPLTGTDHQSDNSPFALATWIPTNVSNQFG